MSIMLRPKAINIFSRRAVRDRGFLFKGRPDVPNKRTIAAMEEALALIADKDAKRYSTEDALQELKK